MEHYLNNSASNFRFLARALDLIVIAYIFRAMFPSEGLSILNIIPSLLFFYSAILIVLQASSYSKISHKFNNLNYIVCTVFISYCLLTILRALSFEPKFLFTLFFNPNIGGIFWLMPLGLFIGRQHGVLPSLLPSFKRHSIIGLIIIVLALFDAFIITRSSIFNPTFSFIPIQLASVGRSLLYVSPIVLFTGLDSSSKSVSFYRICLWALFFGSIVTSVRFYIVYCLFLIVLDLIIGRSKNTLTISKKLAFAFVILGPLMYVFVIWLLSVLDSSLLIDTRSFLFEELLADLNFEELIFGRGALGTYYSPYFDMVRSHNLGGGDSPDRQLVEVFYLHIFLKAGLLGVFLHLFFYLSAIFKSFRYQFSRFSIGSSILLVLSLVQSVITNPPNIYPANIVLWIIVGVLLSANRNSLHGTQTLYKPFY